MLMQYSAEGYGLLAFRQGLAEGFTGRVLPDARACSCIEDFGTITVQEIGTEQFGISYHVCQIRKSICIAWRFAHRWASNCFAIRNDLYKKISGAEPLVIRQGQYVFFPDRGWEGSLFFQPGNYESLYTEYSQEFLAGLPMNLPQQEPNWAGVEILKTIDNILQVPVMRPIRIKYLKNKIDEYLMLQQSSASAPVRSKGLLPHEWDAVRQITASIEADLAKPVRIPEITRQVGISSNRLQKIFNSVHGLSVYDYIIRGRMHEARRLLIETNKAEKEISSLVGYRYLQNFITMFKAYFGHNPSHYRRRVE